MKRFDALKQVLRFGCLSYFFFWGNSAIAIISVSPLTHSAEDDYPASRFGEPPAQADSDMRTEYGDSRGNRAPAGLDLQTENSQPRANPVISDSSMPQSSSNLNPKPSSRERTGTQELSVIVGDLGFFPKVLLVTRDIPVRLYITGISKKTLCIMMDAFQIRKQVRSQKIEEINFTPTQSGQFRFYCPVNGMEGSLLVKDLSTASSIEGALSTRDRSRALTSKKVED